MNACAFESVVSIDALRRNLSHARALAPRSRIWAVVKANAYGHGLDAALEAFADADGLALIEFDRACALRRAGWRRPLLMLEGAFDRDDTRLAAAEGLALVVHEPRQIDWLAAVPADTPRTSAQRRAGSRDAASFAMDVPSFCRTQRRASSSSACTARTTCRCVRSRPASSPCRPSSSAQGSIGSPTRWRNRTGNGGENG